MDKITAFFMSFIALLYGIFGLPYYAVGDKLDLNDYILTFEDEFTALDRSVWSGHFTYNGKSEVRHGSYWNEKLAFSDGENLVIPVTYLEEGMGGTGAGWYTCGIDTDNDSPNGFSQKYGYFEVRCILPKGADIWSAFWLLNSGTFDVDGSGKDGTEIDVFESAYYGKKKNNMISSNLHYDGYDNAHKQLGAHKFLVKGNPYEEYNTYGVLWTENEYIFYINGVESFRTSFGGVSQNPEYLILSVEMSGKNAIPSGRKNSPGEETEYIIDYVRAYQHK